ncbi:MAG: riboflavin synthase [Candidatus Omnitrophica bacterium]|nr:riboflavin synthase [Candidatus Omnitrophota bacterium]MCB9747781.1 riboflavin synthase [Candidatus Omnitrophota bacterium]
MFTGIVEELGIVKNLKQLKNLSILTVAAKKTLRGVKQGDSVAVNGVCLTAIKITKTQLQFDMMKETLEKTTLGRLKLDEYVNLERALKASDRLGGHFVTGHVDEIAVIKDVIKQKNYTEIKITFPKKLKKYIVKKGSICVDGVSLTVGSVGQNVFSVYLIPFTQEVTTFGLKRKGDKVNIEIDILARYILG